MTLLLASAALVKLTLAKKNQMKTDKFRQLTFLRGNFFLSPLSFYHIYPPQFWAFLFLTNINWKHALNFHY